MFGFVVGNREKERKNISRYFNVLNVVAVIVAIFYDGLFGFHLKL